MFKRIIAGIGCALLAAISSTFAIAKGEVFSFTATSPEKLSVKVYFNRSSSDINPELNGNGERLEDFFTALDSLANTPGTKIDSVVLLCSSSSPEGPSALNKSLSLRRASSLEALFRNRFSADVSVCVKSAGEDWDNLAILLRSSDIRGREEVAGIIENTPQYIFENGIVVGGRKKAVMDYDAGRLWREMDKSLFPLLRQAELTVYYTVRQPDIISGSLPAGAVMEAGLEIPEGEPVWPYVMGVTDEPPVEEVLLETTGDRRASGGGNPILALKTNILFDAASIINLGLEIPCGERFSIAADAYFPWWRDKARDITVQMLGADVEGRYWFGDRSRRAPLTGLFAGIYGGAGYYDFQLGNLTGGDGVQGDFYMTGGICAGYAHRIGSSLRLEYSIGIGYLQSDYRQYITAKDTKYGDIKVIPYPWEVKRISGILPTKASVSLVWLISSGKGGAR
ncbi:MAG: DUF3575 domain-containing protein [Candidatus Cryptobacteroides sp.]